MACSKPIATTSASTLPGRRWAASVACGRWCRRSSARSSSSVVSIPDAPARDLRPALELLEGAGLVYRVRHSDATGLPLGSHAKDAVFKLLFLDVGLWGAAQGAGDLADPRARRADEGRLAEQFVGQHLLMSQPSHRRPELYYWLREARSGNAEVDFLTTVEGSNIVPIEVKSASAGSLRSLQQFVLDRGAKLAVRLDANLPSVHTVEAQARRGGTLHPVRFQLFSLPLYLAGHLSRILAAASEPRCPPLTGPLERPASDPRHGELAETHALMTDMGEESDRALPASRFSSRSLPSFTNNDTRRGDRSAIRQAHREDL